MNTSIIVCDFDGTITKVDSINDFLERFADKEWLKVEDEWVAGRVGTCDAMRLQFGMIKGMTQEKFDNFFESVEIDLSFKVFYERAKAKGIKVVIVSDGFEYFVKRVLNKYGIDDIEIYSNSFEFKNGEFLMDFPNKVDGCARNAGACKCKFVEKFKQLYDFVFYVGDGASDFCVADKVDFLFAKKRLSEYCKKNNILFTEYIDFNEVMNNDRLRLNN